MITDSERRQAQKNTTSRQKAINLMCKDCIYDDHEHGTWRQQVEDCPSRRSCPLWNFRPTSVGKKPARASYAENTQLKRS